MRTQGKQQQILPNTTFGQGSRIQKAIAGEGQHERGTWANSFLQSKPHSEVEICMDVKNDSAPTTYLDRWGRQMES